MNLKPEFFTDNLGAKMVHNEIHHGEAVEEKISLYPRHCLINKPFPWKKLRISNGRFPSNSETVCIFFVLNKMVDLHMGIIVGLNLPEQLMTTNITGYSTMIR